MDWKNTFLRGLILATLVLGGIMLYALTANLLVLADLIPAELEGSPFGYAMTMRTSFVVIGGALGGIVSLFIKEKWGRILFFAPLYVPPLFAVVFTLIH